MSDSYEETHPWVTFDLDLSAAPAILWVLLGEAQGLCQQVGSAVLPPRVAATVADEVLARAARASVALAGHTLTEKEALDRVMGQSNSVPQRPDLRAFDNVVAAHRWLATEAGRLGLSVEVIRRVNAQVLAGGADESTTGHFGGGPAISQGDPVVAPGEGEYLLGRLCEWLNGPDFHPQAGMDALYGIVRAVLAHVYLAWLQPFTAGNGRTARLVEAHVLFGSGVPGVAAQLLSEHYGATADEYHDQLARSGESGGGVLPFLLYAVGGLRSGLHRLLGQMRQAQMRTAWADHVAGLFTDQRRDVALRRRQLVMALMEAGGPVGRQAVRYLTPRLTEAYARKVDKTLTRDLAAVMAAGAVRRKSDGFVANIDVIQPFLVSAPVGQA